MTIGRMEKEHQRREECLRQENQDLLYKLENSDKRNEDLTQSVAAATKPLLRQIENLQSSYSARSMSWEKLEKNLTDRLGMFMFRVCRVLWTVGSGLCGSAQTVSLWGISGTHYLQVC